MYLPLPRLHLFEINDQSWFPPTLRHHVQAVLTHFWTIRLPLLQSASPATLVARVLRAQLSSLSEYTFVDFCAGAGGPTLGIEAALNNARSKSGKGDRRRRREGDRKETNGGGDGEDVDFVLTDLHPHLSAWRAAALQSPNIWFVPIPVDASTAPADLLSHAVRHARGHSQSQSLFLSKDYSNNNPTHLSSSLQEDDVAHNRTRTRTRSKNKKQFRLFSLALHHFDDAEASRILRHALRTSSGFAIFELQARTFESMGIMALFGPLMWAGSWWWFWGQWDLLFWMYVLPVVPFVVVFDGVVSSLRTRTEGEVLRLLVKGGGRGGEGGNGRRRKEKGVINGDGDENENENEDGKEEEEKEKEKEKEDPIDLKKWTFQSGTETHTWPLGKLTWFVAVKNDS